MTPAPAFRRMITLATLVLALSAGARAGAGDFTWDLNACALVLGDDLELGICLEGFPCERSDAATPTPVPGVYTFDLRYEIEENQSFTTFSAYAGAPTGFEIGDVWGFEPWCPDPPCGGLITDIAVPAVAGAELSLVLQNAEQGCLIVDAGTRVIIQNLVFTPTPGFHDLGDGLDAAPLHTLDAGALTGVFTDDLDAVGDVDGDGHDDWAAGENGADGGRGVVKVVSGRTGAVLTTHSGNVPQSQLGTAVAGLGDVDMDGVPDLAGSHSAWPGAGQPPTGLVRVWSGADGDLIRNVGPGVVESDFGVSIDGPGDLDGDGRGDLVVGAPEEDHLGENSGRVYVFDAKTGDVLLAFHGAPGERLGRTVAGVGDVDGDGVPDVAGTSIHATAGLCRVWSGADGSVLMDITGDPGDVAATLVGTGVEGAGDVDGDGFCDVIVAGDSADAGGIANAGHVRVVSGADGTDAWEVAGTMEWDFLGRRVDGAGDLDQDGFDDVVVTAVAPLSSAQGRVLALSGPSGAPLFERTDPRLRRLGMHLATGLDTDADGVPDLVTSAQEAETIGGPALLPRLLVLSGDPEDHGAPLLTGLGTLTAGATTELVLGDGPPGGQAWFVLGLSILRAPFKGGVLVPSPDLVLGGLPLDGTGGLTLSFPWPARVASPTWAVVQFWMPEPEAPRGFVASNALVVAPS